MSSWPPPKTVIQAIHDRYQREIIEAMNLCPFARRSREQGRVHRPLFIAKDETHTPEPAEVAARLAELVSAHADAEIVLLTFPVPPGHPWETPVSFEGFLTTLRDAWGRLPPPREFFMVSFHPKLQLPKDRALTPDSLVSLIRRSPDPVIQCVDAAMLGRVRRQAQAAARERMLRELEAKDPALAALFARSIQPDPELSLDIARQNFAAHGAPDDRDRLERALCNLRADRDRAYGLDDDRKDTQ
ncbi:DUF1415 family protein [Pseudenhygromyxa sp. WMMC2535]|uniref:DUF1415 family protein n=1 Tax=Pseudenhygromyxa sp. WMMC2535 TaxID=2712867 RepID=UPI001552A9C6|nr:DUF1415 family protein [Pseudenhygromyxa sp. WMMC2535]